MTVYVDDMYLYPLGKFGRLKMSHMIADTEEELHAMADTIGVQRRWYQGDHYDVAMSKREAALAAGAVPITMRQSSAMRLLRDRGATPWDGPLELPDQAVERWRRFKGNTDILEVPPSPHKPAKKESRA